MQLRSPLVWPRVPFEVARYVGELRRFRREGASPINGPINLEPVLFQRGLASPFDHHYGYQAAWATRLIAKAAPARHHDVSSAVPFVLQLAGIVPVTYLEFNPPKVEFPGLTTEHGTVTALPWGDRSVESLSCMHVVEHVGLGRYGDPIDPGGAQTALRELARVLAPGGTLYLSAPAGRARVAFNAHRVLDPRAVPEVMEREGLSLAGFAYVDDAGDFHGDARPDDAAGMRYGLGMWRLTREG